MPRITMEELMLHHVRCFWNLSQGAVGLLKMHTICPIDFVHVCWCKILSTTGFCLLAVYLYTNAQSTVLSRPQENCKPWKMGYCTKMKRYQVTDKKQRVGQFGVFSLHSFPVTCCAVRLSRSWHTGSVNQQLWSPEIMFFLIFQSP